MPNITDPNGVILTGENSFIRLHDEETGAQLTRTSHWRVLMSDGGSGHVLYITGEETDNEVKIYSDNIALARWLQEEIEIHLYPGFADTDIPVLDAIFDKKGDIGSSWTEIIQTDDETIYMSWYDFKTPYMLTAASGTNDSRPHGVYSCFIPATKAQLTVNGSVAKGVPIAEYRGSTESSSACLAWSETWVKP